ncbi:hypothetical protein F4779DRAFT_590968 [Xylariaceae sp. FL0662B]|nr:hypothetical protein F4779DRAFT_590968 [Xylariaceae sp. FL0662B]
MAVLSPPHLLTDDHLGSDQDSPISSMPGVYSTFTKFPKLPPEIRHTIYLAALPAPGTGINFFNIHCIPNDHPGANRSTSPAWLYLDLRRLDIQHSDSDVFEYDPSVWQARNTLRQVCREARAVCAISEDKAIEMVLTRPKRGLFVRAGDGQLMKLTPFQRTELNVAGTEAEAETNTDNETPSDDRNAQGVEAGTASEQVAAGPERLVHRTIQVHRDDILSLSLENCSFNLAYEEYEYDQDHPDGDDEGDLGWAYDPQLTPALSGAIRVDRICISMARCRRGILLALDHVKPGLFSSLPYFPTHEFVMFDAGSIREEQIPTDAGTFWDRFGDRYLPVWTDSSPDRGPHEPDWPEYFPLGGKYVLTKVSPDTNNIRTRYMQSALLPSPKRPVRSL